MKRGWRVWFNWVSAGLWVILGIISFPFGWSNSVVMVWMASVYANTKTDWGAAEAADDKEVVERLDRIERILILEIRRRRVKRRITRRLP